MHLIQVPANASALRIRASFCSRHICRRIRRRLHFLGDPLDWCLCVPFLMCYRRSAASTNDVPSHFEAPLHTFTAFDPNFRRLPVLRFAG